MALTPERELDLLVNSREWGIFSSSQLGVSPKLALQDRVDTSVGASSSGLTAPPAAPVTDVIASDTGELRWDLNRAGKGLVTVDTPRTKALVGYADDQAVTLGGLVFQPGTTRLGWCSLGATLVRGTSFTNDCNALVVATGWWENSGQAWTTAENKSLAKHWGHTPVLTEVVPFSLTLPVPANRVRAWALDERGQRKAVQPVTGNAATSTLTISTNAGTIWYEIEVTKW